MEFIEMKATHSRTEIDNCTVNLVGKCDQESLGKIKTYKMEPEINTKSEHLSRKGEVSRKMGNTSSRNFSDK